MRGVTILHCTIYCYWLHLHPPPPLPYLLTQCCLLCCTTTTHRYAKEAGVRVTTFDTASELHKIADMHPGFACVLRIGFDDEAAETPYRL